MKVSLSCPLESFLQPNVIFLPMKVLVIANWNGTLKSKKVVEILKKQSESILNPH